MMSRFIAQWFDWLTGGRLIFNLEGFAILLPDYTMASTIVAEFALVQACSLRSKPEFGKAAK